MTLVTITLDEAEQELLLRHAANCLLPVYSWQAIAEKIRRAQDDSMFQGFSLNEELE